MKTLDWTVFARNATSRTSIEITFGHLKCNIENLSESERRELCALLMALDMERKNAARND